MKRIFLIPVILLISTITFGQVNFGIKAGFTMSTLSTDLSDVEDALQTGYQGGAFVRIGDKWHIQPEVYFTLKQGELTYDIPDVIGGSTSSIKQNIKLNTIDVPVLVGWKFLDPPLFNLRLQAGPVASFVSSASFNLTVDGVEMDTPDDFQNSFNDLNWGLQVGAGVDFLMFTVDLRYELGLSDLNEDLENPIEGIPSTFKSNVFFISVGWKIM